MMIRMINISKAYGEHVVLQNFTADFPVGEVSCIMGASGIGKTTLIDILAGLTPADSGDIQGVAGKKFSILFQEDRLLEWETTLTNVLFATATPNIQARFPLKSIIEKYKQTNTNKQNAIDLLTKAGLSDHIYKPAAELSGGMKRRAALCRALLPPHDILILDEPFKGLDGELKKSIMQLTLDTFHSFNKYDAKVSTLICITHDPAEAEFMGGNIMML